MHQKAIPSSARIPTFKRTENITPEYPGVYFMMKKEYHCKLYFVYEKQFGNEIKVCYFYYLLRPGCPEWKTLRLFLSFKSHTLN